MKIGKKEMKKRVEAFVNELNQISFAQVEQKKCILGDLIEILESKTYDQVERELGSMSTNQMTDLATNDMLYHLNKKD